MAERKTYVILGLGRFGQTLAKQLTDFNQDVIAIDKDMAVVEKVSAFVANALCMDYSDIDALAAAGVKDADTGIVTTGTMLDQAIQGVMNLKELGVPYVLAKANNIKTARLLEKVGADKTITPEHDMAVRCARALISNDILEMVDVDAENSLLKIKVLSNWVGHNLKQLDLRTKYSINVIGIERDGKLSVNVNPDEEFKENDEVLLVASNDIYKHFSELNKI